MLQFVATQISGFLNLILWQIIDSNFVSKVVTCSTHLGTEEVKYFQVPFMSHSLDKWSFVEIFYHNIPHSLPFLSLRMNKIENENLLCDLEFNLILFCIVGEQNLPPPNISLAFRLFLAKNNQGPKNSGRNFDLSLNCLKNLEGQLQE